MLEINIVVTIKQMTTLFVDREEFGRTTLQHFVLNHTVACVRLINVNGCRQVERGFNIWDSEKVVFAFRHTDYL